MIKEINWQGYNQAVVKSIDSDGMVICDVQEMVDDVVVRSDTNIGFRKSDNMPFELTDEEIEEINNPVIEAEDENI
jgi:hypothetical protein